MIANGAKLNAKSKDGKTALIYASQSECTYQTMWSQDRDVQDW